MRRMAESAKKTKNKQTKKQQNKTKKATTTTTKKKGGGGRGGRSVGVHAGATCIAQIRSISQAAVENYFPISFTLVYRLYHFGRCGEKETFVCCTSECLGRRDVTQRQCLFDSVNPGLPGASSCFAASESCVICTLSLVFRLPKDEIKVSVKVFLFFKPRK